MNLAQAFMDRFCPAPQAHGIYDAPPPGEPGKKRKGKGATIKAPLTLEAIERHLRGEQRIGFVPIHRDGRCRFGVIDIDDYRLDLKALAAKVRKLKLPLVVCPSKSGGAHLYRLYAAWRAAREVREELSDTAALLGYSGVEIFPKQESITADGEGNWINAPYFGEECHALDAEGRELPLEEFLALPIAPDAPPEARSACEKCAAILAPHWVAGKRDNLAVAVYGTLLRNGWTVHAADAVVRDVSELAGDEEAAARVKGPEMERRLNADRRMPGIPALRELIGDAATTFLRAAGIAEGPTFELEPIPAEWLDAPPPPLEFTVDGWLPRRTVAMVVAEGGTGKTNFLLRMALCVASGRPFLGQDTRPGRVAFVGLEDNAESLRRRVNWIWRCERERMEHEKASPEAIERVRAAALERLMIVSAVGQELHLVRMYDGQVVQNAGALKALTAQLAGVELLVLDPMARLSGAEENSNAVGTALVNAAERLARAVGCAVVIAHHTGKASAKDRDTSLYAARGASGLADAARSVLRLLVADESDLRNVRNLTPEAIARGEVVRVIHAKCNEAARQPDLWLRRQASDFERWEPEDGGKEEQTRRVMVLIFRWWIENGRLPFTKDAAIAGLNGKVARDKARDAITLAQHRGDIVESGAKAERNQHPKLTFRNGYDPDPM